VRRPDSKRLSAIIGVTTIVLAALALTLRAPEQSDPADAATTPQVVESSANHRPSQDSQPPEAPPATAATTANAIPIWIPIDPTAVDAPPKIRDELPATLLQLNRTALESLTEGDTLTLPISTSLSARMQVGTIKLNSNFGVTSLRGSTLVNGISLPTVITYGANSTLATISTAEGVYELRGTADMGWLYRSVDLGLPGGDAVDYVTPADPGTQP
jgi:hypothetical protein